MINCNRFDNWSNSSLTRLTDVQGLFYDVSRSDAKMADFHAFVKNWESGDEFFQNRSLANKFLFLHFISLVMLEKNV